MGTVHIQNGVHATVRWMMKCILIVITFLLTICNVGFCSDFELGRKGVRITAHQGFSFYYRHFFNFQKSKYDSFYAQFEPGTGGAKFDLGYKSSFNKFGFSTYRTFGKPWNLEKKTTYLGVNGQIQYFLATFYLGAYTSISDNSSKNSFITYGVGLEF